MESRNHKCNFYKKYYVNICATNCICEYFYRPTFELLFIKLGQAVIFSQTPEYSHPNCDPMKFLKVFCLQNKLEKLNFLKKYSVCNCVTFCIVCVYYVPNFWAIIHEIKSNGYVSRSQWIISPLSCLNPVNCVIFLISCNW